MNKKELKLYEAPAQEVVELRLQGILCSSPDPKNPFDGNTGDAEEME